MGYLVLGNVSLRLGVPNVSRPIPIYCIGLQNEKDARRGRDKKGIVQAGAPRLQEAVGVLTIKVAV